MIPAPPATQITPSTMLEPFELFDRGFLHPGRNAKFQLGFDVSGRAARGIGRNFGFSGRFWPSCALGSRVGWALSPTDGRSAKQKKSFSRMVMKKLRARLYSPATSESLEISGNVTKTCILIKKAACRVTVLTKSWPQRQTKISRYCCHMVGQARRV